MFISDWRSGSHRSRLVERPGVGENAQTIASDRAKESSVSQPTSVQVDTLGRRKLPLFPFAVLAFLAAALAWMGLEQFVNALTLGAIYALIALGYTMVYGIIELINFAHGDVFMVATFVTMFVSSTILGQTSSVPNIPELAFYLVVTFACTAGCIHILPFIAGANSRFAEGFSASAMHVNASSAIPCASFARQFAVAGAMRSKAASSASRMCVGCQPSSSS